MEKGSRSQRTLLLILGLALILFAVFCALIGAWLLVLLFGIAGVILVAAAKWGKVAPKAWP